MPDALGVQVVIIPRSSTAEEMIMLDVVEVADREPLEAMSGTRC